MTKEELLNFALKALNYNTEEQLLNATGLKITPISLSNYRYINIFNADPFYSSYSSGSMITFSLAINTDPFLVKETLTSLKTKVAAKLRQQRKLEGIKQKGLRNIREYLSDAFKIPAHLIDDSDINFMKFSQFKVGGVLFSYSGTIVSESFKIHTSIYTTYARMYEITNAMNDFFNDKQLKYDSKH